MVRHCSCHHRLVRVVLVGDTDPYGCDLGTVLVFRSCLIDADAARGLCATQYYEMRNAMVVFEHGRTTRSLASALLDNFRNNLVRNSDAPVS
jgi:hypothetical protein